MRRNSSSGKATMSRLGKPRGKHIHGSSNRLYSYSHVVMLVAGIGFMSISGFLYFQIAITRSLIMADNDLKDKVTPIMASGAQNKRLNDVDVSEGSGSNAKEVVQEDPNCTFREYVDRRYYGLSSNSKAG